MKVLPQEIIIVHHIKISLRSQIPISRTDGMRQGNGCHLMWPILDVKSKLGEPMKKMPLQCGECNWRRRARYPLMKKEGCLRVIGDATLALLFLLMSAPSYPLLPSPCLALKRQTS